MSALSAVKTRSDKLLKVREVIVSGYITVIVSACIAVIVSAYIIVIVSPLSKDKHCPAGGKITKKGNKLSTWLDRLRNKKNVKKNNTMNYHIVTKIQKNSNNNKAHTDKTKN